MGKGTGTIGLSVESGRNKRQLVARPERSGESVWVGQEFYVRWSQIIEDLVSVDL